MRVGERRPGVVADELGRRADLAGGQRERGAVVAPAAVRSVALLLVRRNGATSKTLETDLGPVEIKTPRDRDSSFEPRQVAKRQTRLVGLDDKVLGLYGGGMTVRDISNHLSEIYGTELGRNTHQPDHRRRARGRRHLGEPALETVYPIVSLDAMRVKVREDRSVKNLAAYLAMGITCDGEREDTYWLPDARRAGSNAELVAAAAERYLTPSG